MGHPVPYCRGHAPGRFATGPAKGSWKGGRILRRGYVMIRLPEHHLADSKGYAPEHRVVWEEANGRLLMPGQCVHHINGNPQDNRPENLVAITNFEHGKIHGAEAIKAWAEREPDAAFAARSLGGKLGAAILHGRA